MRKSIAILSTRFTTPREKTSSLVLAYWSGLSQSEVAEFLGIPLGTVKTRTRGALMKLSDILEGELE